MFKKRIYLDYAALTPIDPRVFREFKKYSGHHYANASSLYKEGVAAKKVLENSRKVAAQFIHAHPDEIYFTSGGTEANNLAIIGAVESLCDKGVRYEDMHVVISAIEHSSVIECANHLSNKGVIIDRVIVEADGVISLADLKKKIKPNTVIVSIMTVNNEIGAVQPIREIVKIIRQARKVNAENSPFTFQSEISYPLFHTDAAQAPLFYELNMEKLGVDLLTIDASKLYGPRATGFLYSRRRTPIAPVIYGGGQESGLRSGTENIAAIAGFAKALELAKEKMEPERKRVQELKDLFSKKLLATRPDIKINPAPASETSRSPHVLSVSIPGIDNEFLVLQLDVKGISCSTKSSCLRDQDESHVLRAIGVSSHTTLRFSFGRWTKKSHILKAVRVIRALILR